MCTPIHISMSIFYSNELIVRMASKQASETDSFLSSVETARVRLGELVSAIRVSVREREEELSAELDRLEREHRVRVSECRDKRCSLAGIQAGIEEQFKGGGFEDLKKSFLSETERKLEMLEREYPSRSVEFVCEEGLVEKVKGMGKIEVSVESIRRCEVRETGNDTHPKGSSKELNVEVAELECVEKPLPIPDTDDGAVDYTTRTKPVATFGYPQMQCRYPQGLVYHPEENTAYFVDYLTPSVYILSLTSNKIRTISTPVGGFYKTNQFCDICLYNRTCLVSALISPVITGKEHFIYGILLVDLSVGPHPSFPKQLNLILNHDSVSPGDDHTIKPSGITIDDQTLYVCNLWKNSIKVIDLCDGMDYVRHIRTITDPDMYLPLDVKIHAKRIFVLNSKPPYVLEFDLTGFRRNAFLSHSILPDFLPSFFCVDKDGRFLISDRRRPYVYVLGREASMRAAVQSRLDLLHGEDTLVEPRGVCLDGEGRVLVLCSYKQAMLQIF